MIEIRTFKRAAPRRALLVAFFVAWALASSAQIAWADPVRPSLPSGDTVQRLLNLTWE